MRALAQGSDIVSRFVRHSSGGRRMWSLRRSSFAMVAGLFVALSAPTGIALAQASGTIRGTVTDSTNGRGVPGVQITIFGTTRGAVTNDRGVYTLTAVPAGAANLRAQRLGYSTLTHAVTVVAGEAVTADFVLRPVATVALRRSSRSATARRAARTSRARSPPWTRRRSPTRRWPASTTRSRGASPACR